MEKPLINCMQRIVLYETKSRFYVVGSNNAETRFRILKIDRTESRDLVIHDDKMEYSLNEVRSLLSTLNVGNKSRGQKVGMGLTRTVSAFGIVGFVRFLEGYYIILITKRRKVALIGHHTIFKIEDTCMLYIPADLHRIAHPDEPRYIKMFNNVDLKSNFYFSYSYDLTHTLQYNMSPTLGVENNADLEVSQSIDYDSIPVLQRQQSAEDVESAADVVVDPQDIREVLDMVVLKRNTPSPPIDGVLYGIKNEPTLKFVWNLYFLNSFRQNVHTDWILYMTHGFIGQMNINVFGKPMFLTLIGRRSNKFAGTRFLKRGINVDGDVANHTETEQIIQDTSILSLTSTRISSFVQTRGSVPLFWSQDTSKMMPKPAIQIDQADPLGYAAGQHFDEMLQRFGCPLIVLNLVKRKESSRKHESVLRDEFIKTIDYLNQFLPEEHAIQYIGFDMAHINKRKKTDVFEKFKDIAETCVRKCGFYYSRPALYCHQMGNKQKSKRLVHDRGNRQEGSKSAAGSGSGSGLCYQTGIVRTNCVDCLDRTNTAQFAIGKTALAYQLYEFGVIDSPRLEFGTDCVKMLEELYEDHGDTLALQYGGSQLVHRIETYRKSSVWTSHSRDIMQTLQRYYSNAFSDADKQHAINLFLGVYKPYEQRRHIWELPTDFYLHNIPELCFKKRSAYSQWFNPDIFSCLPMPHDQITKGFKDKPIALKTKNDEKVDTFREYYKPYELTSLDELFCRHIQSKHTVSKQDTGTFGHSPFQLHAKRLRSKDSMEQPDKNPNISGKESIESMSSSWSSDSPESSSDSDIEGDISLIDNTLSNQDHSHDSSEHTLSNQDHSHDSSEHVTFKEVFPTMNDIYGVNIRAPSKANVNIYKKQMQIGVGASQTVADGHTKPSQVELVRKSAFTCDSTTNVTPPTVSKRSKELYKNCVSVAVNGPIYPDLSTIKIYKNYVSKLCQ